MEITQITQPNTELCNTKIESSVVQTHADEKWRCRNWSIVLNNYTEDDIYTFTHLEDCKGKVCKEVGKSGTPHLQSYFEFKNAKSMMAIKKLFKNDKLHCEPAYKCREANKRYCVKGEIIRDDFPTTFKYQGRDLPKEEDLYDWQKFIVDLISKPADDRHVYWFYEPEGNSGKTKFGKYLCFHNPNVCLTTATKSADILTSVNDHFNVYILDFPRTLGSDYCPYTAIEQLKNGFITDAKLKKEARIVMFDPPHVIIFSNHPPERSKLSRDRWQVYNIYTNTWELN